MMAQDTEIKFNNQKFGLMISDEADRSVVSEIFKHHEYRIADEAISKAKIIVDVGAHRGYFAIYCRALNSQAKIFCIEPEKNNLEVLRKHIKLNKLKKITVIAAALSDYSGEGELVVKADSHNHFLGDAPTSTEITQKVSTYTFSNFCAENKISNIDLLKMDIEGGEYRVFSVFSPLDFVRVKNLVMEYHNFKDRNYKSIESLLRENGFGVQVFPSKFDKTMGFLFAHNKRVK
jgi:FkbM family methyltransferase